MFITDNQRQLDALTKDKKSTDAKELVALLRQAIAGGDTNTLAKFIVYLESRHQRLKEELKDEEQSTIQKELNRLYENYVFILRWGEIEDYLPGASDVKSIIEMVMDRNWINRVDDQQKRLELGRIVASILGLDVQQREALENDLKTRSVAFPPPISEQIGGNAARH